MLKKLLNHISEQKLFQPEEKILLAVSGGIDSVVMAHLFRQTEFVFAFTHCNFQLRGNESNEDQTFVEQLAHEYGCPCYTKSFDSAGYAKKHKISIQMAARELRRVWFEELLKDEKYDVVATAHHLNDSLETVLFNLTKGTGISGLMGIAPRKENYVRPLMFATRDMILKYAKSNKISWREDRSNSSTKYHRNLIRHQVIPELKKINPNLEETFSSSMAKIRATWKLLEAVLVHEKNELCEDWDGGIKIDKTKLISSREPLFLLHEFIADFGFNYRQSADIIRSIGGQPGKCFHAEKYQLVIDRDFIFLTQRTKHEFLEVFIDRNDEQVDAGKTQLVLEKVESDEVQFSDDHNIAFLDNNLLEYPLKLRKWEKGDRFRPLGMPHKKKLSDFMIDEKIPLNLKKHVLVLTSGSEIVWVVGYRIDDRYKITAQTTDICKIYNVKKHD